MISHSVSVIVPVYNNRESLSELHGLLVETLEGLTQSFELLFVNDGSSDGSSEILDQICEADPRAIHVKLSRNFGQHPAIHAGLVRSRGDLVILMDADLQDDPREIPGLVHQLIESSADIAFTSIASVGRGTRPRFSSSLFHRLFGRIVRNKVPNNYGTFRVFSRRVRDALLEYPERSIVYGPLMLQIGFRSTTRPVPRHRAVGRSTSYRLTARVRLAVASLLYYGSSLPVAVVVLGLIVSLGSLLYLALVLFAFLLGQRSLPPGNTLILSVSLLTSGILTLSVGVLALYTFQTFREVLGRPRYHIVSMSRGGIDPNDE